MVWHNAGRRPQTVVFDPSLAEERSQLDLKDDAPAWGSGWLYPGETWSHTFDAPGTYLVFSRPGDTDGSIGVIHVGAEADMAEDLPLPATADPEETDVPQAGAAADEPGDEQETRAEPAVEPEREPQEQPAEEPVANEPRQEAEPDIGAEPQADVDPDEAPAATQEAETGSQRDGLPLLEQLEQIQSDINEHIDEQLGGGE